MGKRKECRLAAIIATNQRVKPDLFTELYVDWWIIFYMKLEGIQIKNTLQESQCHYLQMVSIDLSLKGLYISLALKTEASDGQNISLAAEVVGFVVYVHTVAHVDSEILAYAYATSAGFINPISQHVVDYGIVLGTRKEDTEVVQLSSDTDQCLTHYNTGVDGISYHGSSMMSEYDSLHQSQTAFLGKLTTVTLKAVD